MQLLKVLLAALPLAIDSVSAAPTAPSTVDKRACSTTFPAGVSNIHIGASPQDLTFSIPAGAGGPCSLVATFPANYPITSTGSAQVGVYDLNGPAQGSLVGSATFGSSPSGPTFVTINSFACRPTMSYRFQMVNAGASVDFAEGNGAGIAMTYSC